MALNVFSHEADLPLTLGRVGDPPQVLTLDTFSCAPWRGMRHGWEIITDHKTRQAENILSFKLQQSVVSMLIGKWDLRLEKGVMKPDGLLDHDKELGGGVDPGSSASYGKGRLSSGHIFLVSTLGRVERQA